MTNHGPFSQTPDLLEPLRVLHVEADMVSHTIVSRCLQRAPGAGCNLRFAGDLADAREIVLRSPADVILLDLDLPGFGGLAALERALALDLGAPIIALTNQEDPTIGVAAISAGAEDFLAKDELSPYRLWNTVLHGWIRWRKTRRTRGPPTERPAVRSANPEPLTQDLAPGMLVDRYVVEERIGQGGMAIVYQVRHRTLDSIHALKVLYGEGGKHQERLLQEARAQARLRHPNLVRCTDVLQLHCGLGVVMEYVQGPTLAQWLRDNSGSLEGLDLFRGIVRGVRHAHAMGLVHRDLKPSNILIETVEGRLVPKITDFGIVKAAPSDGSIGVTEQGVSMGTPGYMAPEQISDAGSVDARADLFSLGCILYEMVVGRAPFRGRHRLQILNAVVTGNYPRAGAVVAGLPPALEHIIDLLLEADPRDRLGDCATLLRMLDQIAADELPSRLVETPCAPTSRYTHPGRAQALPSIVPHWAWVEEDVSNG